MDITIDEDSMSSLDAYTDPSSLLQMSLFNYKPRNLWLRNHRCPVTRDGENRRWTKAAGK